MAKKRILNYSAEEIDDILAGVETVDSELSENSKNTVKNKAVFNQYMTDSDIENILDSINITH